MVRKLFSSFMFATLHTLKRELANHSLWAKNGHHSVPKVKFYWNTAIAVCWCITFACLCATTGKLKSYNRDGTAYKTYNILYLALCQKVCWYPSPYPKVRESHRAPWWKDIASQSGKKSRGNGRRGEHRGDAERKGSGRGVQKGIRGSTKKGAGQQAHLRGRPGLRRQHIPSLKSFPETYRPECKFWCASNTSWNLCSALYARMVQSPRREDAKWDNTGLRARKTETDTRQRKSGRLDERKPTVYCSVVTLPVKGHTWGCLKGCLGEEGWRPFQREASMWPSKSCSQSGNERFLLNLSLIKLKSQLDLDKLFTSPLYQGPPQIHPFQILWHLSSCKLFTI